MKVDLHLHSQYSWDSKVKISDYIKKAEKLDFGAISITDHNSIKSHAFLSELQKNSDVILIPGQEVSTIDGHLLIYGWVDQIEKGHSMKETVLLAKEQEGICIAAHPFDFFRKSGFSQVFETGIDGIEIFNASSWINLPNWLASRAIKKYDKFIGLSNSDSHALTEFGCAWTEIPFSENQNEVFSNLIHGIPHGSRIGIVGKIKRLIKRKINN